MIVCHICPPRMAKEMYYMGMWNQMLLAHEWTLQDPPLRMEASSLDGYVIMDNGAWERSEVTEVSLLVALAQHHHANALVLPDVLGDALRTRVLVDDALPQVKCAGLRPIAVCQGMTLEELRGDAEFYANLGVDFVGMPSKLMYPQWRAWRGPCRHEVLDRLCDLLLDVGLRVHLLGVMERPTELFDIATDPALEGLCVSVDTATALRWAFFEQSPQWWPMIDVPRWIWERLEWRDLAPSVLCRWVRNRVLLERWARAEE